MRLLPLVLLSLLCLAPGVRAACLDISELEQRLEKATDPGERKTLARQLGIVKDEFPFTRAEALKALRESYPVEEYPLATAEFLDNWLDTESCVVLEGGKMFYQGLVRNVAYRNFELSRKQLAKVLGQSPLFDQARHWVFQPELAGFPRKSWKPYSEPVEYEVEVSLDLPRKELPESGNIRVWMPLAIEAASQRDVRLVSISPEEALAAVPRTDGPLGLACFDISLQGRTEDVNIRATLLYKSYVQRFHVDPDKVLPYDTSSDVWRTYTRPGPNIVVTPEIESRAMEASKGAPNPYLAARNIYGYILENIKYSLTPHATLMVLGQAEALWVDENRYGDCGAQSMYFAAMCRALGIPARATGGYQVFPGYAGPHFWAEVYIEGYGWIPVDPTVADAADWTGAIDEEQRRAFKEFYFGNLDPFRQVVQRDVDIPLWPAPRDNFLTGERPLMVFQIPWLDCPECEKSPLDLVLLHYSWKATTCDR